MMRTVSILATTFCACFTLMGCGAAYDGQEGSTRSELIAAGDPGGDPPVDDGPDTVEKPVSYPAGGKCKILAGVNRGLIGTYDSKGWCCSNNNCTYCPQSSCQTLLTTTTSIDPWGNPVYYADP